MNSAYLSAFAALAGSAIGAFATFATTWLTQRYQDRAQRAAQESTRRERIFGDFIDQASKLYADALTHELEDISKVVPLYATVGRLRLFASLEAINSAKAVLDRIVASYNAPNLDLQVQRRLGPEELDLLQDFTKICRRDLDRG